MNYEVFLAQLQVHAITLDSIYQPFFLNLVCVFVCVYTYVHTYVHVPAKLCTMVDFLVSVLCATGWLACELLFNFSMSASPLLQERWGHS